MALTMNTALAELQPSGIRRITAFAKQTPGCILLTLGEPDGNTAESVKAKVAESLAATRPTMARPSCARRCPPIWRRGTFLMMPTRSL